MNSILYNFSTNLRYLRKQQNLTQEQLAEMLNYSKKSISKWESGQALPPSVVLPDIAKIFRTTIDDMMASPLKIKYYLGITGYDDRTDFALADSEGRIIAHVTLGNSNPSDVGFDKMKKVINEGIFKLVDAVPYSNIFVYAGIDGIYNIDKRVLSDHLSGYGFAKVDCGSTTQSTLNMAFGKSQGIFVAAGQGSVVYAVSNGEIKARLGGYGYLFDEPFCLYTLAKSVIVAVLKHEEGSGDFTIMSDFVKRKINSNITIRQYLKGLGRAELSKFGPIVFEAYTQGDRIAKEIIEQNLRELARMVKIASKYIHQREVRISLYGSLSQFEDYFLPTLKEYLFEDEHTYKVEISKTPQVNGALLMAGLTEVKTFDAERP